jgi:hypothetical protein
MTIPPVVAVTVPIAVPIPRALCENVFLPVSAETIISVTEIVSVPEVASGISLVPHACDGWISVIRESRETISLADTCSREWTRPGKRYPAWIYNWLAKHSPPGRAHCK